MANGARGSAMETGSKSGSAAGTRDTTSTTCARGRAPLTFPMATGAWCASRTKFGVSQPAPHTHTHTHTHTHRWQGEMGVGTEGPRPEYEDARAKHWGRSMATEPRETPELVATRNKLAQLRAKARGTKELGPLAGLPTRIPYYEPPLVYTIRSEADFEHNPCVLPCMLQLLRPMRSVPRCASQSHLVPWFVPRVCAQLCHRCGTWAWCHHLRRQQYVRRSHGERQADRVWHLQRARRRGRSSCCPCSSPVTTCTHT